MTKKKIITNYSYSVDENGTLTIYTQHNGQTFVIATLEECVRPSAKDKGIRNLIEDVLYEMGYELKEAK